MKETYLNSFQKGIKQIDFFFFSLGLFTDYLCCLWLWERTHICLGPPVEMRGLGPEVNVPVFKT